MTGQPWFYRSGALLCDGKYRVASLLPLPAVRCIGLGVLAALSHLASKGIVHADVKPENVAFAKDTSSTVRLMDFNTSMRTTAGKPLKTYAQSRWCRAPEVILRMHYGQAIDLWSAGCLFYELATGHPLFSGASDHEMLQHHASLLGLPTMGFLQRGRADCVKRQFLVTGTGQIALRRPLQPSARMIGDLKEADVKARLSRRFRAIGLLKDAAPERHLWEAFVDLLAGLLTWNPDARLTAERALQHKFFSIINSDFQPLLPTITCRLPRGRAFHGVTCVELRDIAVTSDVQFRLTDALTDDIR
jgi:serine/threonine protein kinase